MTEKEDLIFRIKSGLHNGVISVDDLRPIVGDVPSVSQTSTKPAKKPDKLSAVDIMFYIAGLVLFSTIISVIAQSWDGGNAILHILLSAGVGFILWAVAYYLIKSPLQSDLRKGLVNALLLTGSLSVISGGYIITNYAFGDFDEVDLIPIAWTLAALGVIHLGFDRLVKRDLTIMLGIILSVGTFPALLFGMLQDTDVPPDVWAVIVLATLAILAYSTRVLAKVDPAREKLRDSLDLLVIFGGLATMYITSFSEYGIVWLLLLIGSVFGIFYLSITTQNKNFLGTASFFMVLTVITISFKYFSGFGITLSLVMATIGLLASAAVANSISKKYFPKT